MSTFDLGLNEVVIMQDTNVHERKASITLVLTNQNIIQCNKNIRGSVKSFEKHPLLCLREHDGKPNILVGKGPNGKTQLELYFSGYEKYYSFQGLLTERKWANAIEKAYKACVSEKKKSEKEKLRVGSLLSPLKESFGTAKQLITPKVKPSEIRTTKCPVCGADISGEKGQNIKCSYCDTIVKVQ